MGQQKQKFSWKLYGNFTTHFKKWFNVVMLTFFLETDKWNKTGFAVMKRVPDIDYSLLCMCEKIVYEVR